MDEADAVLFLFDLMEDREEFFRGKCGLQFQGEVSKIRLIRQPVRRSIQSGGAFPDGPRPLFQRTDPVFQIPVPVSEIAAK